MDLLSIKVSLIPVSITRIHYKRKAMVYICMSIIFFYGTVLMNCNNYFVLFFCLPALFGVTQKMRWEITSFTTMFDLKYFSPFSHINLPGFKAAVTIRQELSMTGGKQWQHQKTFVWNSIFHGFHRHFARKVLIRFTRKKLWLLLLFSY